MRADKNVSRNLTAQAEKIASEAWEIVDRCDSTETYTTKEVVDPILSRAQEVIAGAQNKTEAKRLNKIFDSALWNLKHCIA